MSKPSVWTSSDSNWNGARIKNDLIVQSYKADLKNSSKLIDGKFGTTRVYNLPNCSVPCDTNWFGGSVSGDKVGMKFSFNGSKRLFNVTINALNDKQLDNKRTRRIQIFTEVDINLYWNESLQLHIKKTYKHNDKMSNVIMINMTIPLFDMAADEVEMTFTFPSRMAIGEIRYEGEGL